MQQLSTELDSGRVNSVYVPAPLSTQPARRGALPKSPNMSRGSTHVSGVPPSYYVPPTPYEAKNADFHLCHAATHTRPVDPVDPLLLLALRRLGASERI